MRRGVGGSAGFVALLALVLHTQSGTEPGGSSALTKGKEKPKSAAAAPPQSDQPAEGPWIATQAFFRVPNHRVLDPSGPVPEKTRILLETLVSSQKPINEPDLRQLLGLPDPSSYSAWSMVATVSDPRHTRLSLFFDRQIEAMERSFQMAGWEFATQWLPWVDPFNGEENDISERRRQRWLERQQEELPGILVFRHVAEKETGGPEFKPKVFFVLLVPETPIAGVSGPSFFAAMRVADLLSTEDHRIGLLAPTFSGSFFSLSGAVVEWKNSSWTKKHRLNRKVYSGSISSHDYAEAFWKQTGLRFFGGIATSLDYRKTFERMIQEYGIEPSQAAYLVEDESGFSQSFKARQKEDKGRLEKDNGRLEDDKARLEEDKIRVEEDKIPRFIYPRDINHLRNAYREDAAAPGADRRQAPASSIDFSLKDPNEGEDGIPTFSDKQSPLSQDAVVTAITSEMKRRRTRLIFIAATNSLDSLFLARLVRQDSPDTRILIGNADILFVPAAAQNALAGTLFLSTYPRFLEGGEWLSGSPGGDRLLFPSPEFEGTFNEAQLLLSDMGALGGKGPQLEGYRQFANPGEEKRAAHPGLWLLTLTHTGFIPVDLFDENHPSHAGWFKPVVGDVNPPVPEDGPPPFDWTLMAILLSVAVYSGSFLLVGCNFGLFTKPAWLGLTDGYPHRLLALLGACLSASAALWVLAFPVWRAALSSQSPTAAQNGMGAFTFLAFLAPIVTWGILIGRLKMSRERTWKILLGIGSPGLGKRVMVYGGLATLLFFLLLRSWTQACLSQRKASTAFFYRFRALDIFSGTSPALPVEILAVLFFVFSMFYFKRYTRAGLGRPRLALTKMDWPALKEEHAQIEMRVLAPVQLAWPAWWWRTGVAVLAMGVGLVLLDWTRDLNAFEIRGYNLVLILGTGVALYCIAVNCYDLTLLWLHVRRLLSLIELLPLKPALDRVSREWPRQPIWAFRRSVSRQLVDQQMLYALHNRRVLEPQGRAIKTAAADEPKGRALEQFEKFREVAFHHDQDQASAAPVLERRLLDLEKYESVSAEIAADIIRNDLVPAWGANVNDDFLSGEDAPQTPAQKSLRYSSDFVALQLSRYIVYDAEQTRRIALNVSVAFLILTLFLNSYSLQGPLAVSRFLAVLFLGAGLVVCQVLAGMERHPILSKISRTKPGELNREFWAQLIALGGLPFLGVLAHLFPSISRFLFSWVAPSVEAIH